MKKALTLIFIMVVIITGILLLKFKNNYKYIIKLDDYAAPSTIFNIKVTDTCKYKVKTTSIAAVSATETVKEKNKYQGKLDNQSCLSFKNIVENSEIPQKNGKYLCIECNVSVNTRHEITDLFYNEIK